MSQIKLTTDISDVLRLGKDYQTAAEVGLRQATERGEQLVRDEVPKATHNLAQGVSSEVKKRGGLLQGEIIVSARSGRLGRRTATLHLASGKTKQITLRAVPSYNYGEIVATGKPAQLHPKKAQVFLIPVTSVPTLAGKVESYIESDGKTYIVRRSIKAVKPNPYDQRAAARLENEAPGIFDSAIKKFVGGQP